MVKNKEHITQYEYELGRETGLEEAASLVLADVEVKDLEERRRRRRETVSKNKPKINK